MSSRRFTLIITAATILLILIGLYGYTYTKRRDQITLKVFHAGSLTAPLEVIEARFEADHPQVDVQLEPGGSVQCVRKITEIGELCDVIAVADYSLIPELMEEYADWYIIFARNEMTIAYSENSRYADEINEENWYQVLQRPGVKWGFSNPNLDPCGYRTLMLIQLAEKEYGDDMLFEALVSNHTAITSTLTNGTYLIDTNMEDLKPDTDKVSIREKSVELVSLVESGGLDYAFEYSSVAKQHGMLYLDLPASIDLSDISYIDRYGEVRVMKISGLTEAKPIVYGVTVPNNAEHPEIAAEFIKYMIDEEGDTTFYELGQPPIDPAVINDMTAAPETLIPYLSERN